MDILVLGGGGREHALVVSLAASPHAGTIYVAPGNGGTRPSPRTSRLECRRVATRLLKFAQGNDIDLVVIGPEAPLVAGVADVLRAAGIPVFGPDAQGAQLEGSKTFCKEFMMRHNLPTAEYLSTSDEAAAHAYIDEQGAPIVVKADGLAAGKGVVVAQTADEAHDAVRECFAGAFGDAGNTVVIEECLTGPECSMLAFVSAGKAYCMAPAQDHKRAYDGDKGPNTGGMGAYSPVPIVTDEELARMEQVMADAAAATAVEFDNDYRGVLYGGFMLTPAGPKLLEFNARFGDPETQVVLPRMHADLVEVMLAGPRHVPTTSSSPGAQVGGLRGAGEPRATPKAYEKGKVITGIKQAELLDDVTVYHAGTKLDEDGRLLTDGGRVLDVTALGDSFEEARKRAYLASAMIDFEGKYQRNDIGERALRGRSAWEV